MNLKLLRERNIVEKMMDFLKEHSTPKFHDQTVLNYVCMGKIGSIPARFGLYNHNNEEETRNFYDGYPVWYQKYRLTELLAARINPALVHLALLKPWNYYPSDNILIYDMMYNSKITLWWQYRNLTDYFPKDIDQTIK